jgi:hypothetical protein
MSETYRLRARVLGLDLWCPHLDANGPGRGLHNAI